MKKIEWNLRKNMASRFFLQAVLLCVFLSRCAAGETARQKEIVRELETFRPSWAAEGGVWMLASWDTDEGLEGLVAFPGGGGNAASRFRMLEEWYLSEAEELRGDGSETRGVEALLEAAEMKECRLIPDEYPEFDSAESKQPDFRVLREYLQGLLRRAEKAAMAGDRLQAERCYGAALLCGRHLTNDKSSSIVFVTGLIFKMRGAQGYAGYLLRAGEGEKAARAKAYADRVAEAMRAFTWKANVALSEFGGFACLLATVRIAREDAEAFWRKEAVVRLATLRYGVPDEQGRVVERNVEYERIADGALSAVAEGDADRSVRRLAVWAALHVTPKGYAEMEHRFSDFSSDVGPE
jgi:hypothetical protein